MCAGRWLLALADRQIGLLPAEYAAFQIVDLFETLLAQFAAYRHGSLAAAAVDDQRTVPVLLQPGGHVAVIGGCMHGIDDMSVAEVPIAAHVDHDGVLVVQQPGGLAGRTGWSA